MSAASSVLPAAALLAAVLPPGNLRGTVLPVLAALLPLAELPVAAALALLLPATLASARLPVVPSQSVVAVTTLVAGVPLAAVLACMPPLRG